MSTLKGIGGYLGGKKRKRQGRMKHPANWLGRRRDPANWLGRRDPAN